MLSYLTAGESHGPQLTVIIDGLPSGLSISLEQINVQLSRRQKGYGRGGRMKIERDRAEILSGVRSGKTMGGPITLVIANRDWENWKEIMDPSAPVASDLGLKKKRLALETTMPRPGHADLPGGVKWNHHDLRNVLERASARETAARVGVGAIARQLIEHFGVRCVSHVVRIGEAAVGRGYDSWSFEEIAAISEASEVRCLDPSSALRMIAAIRAAKKNRDSLGGVVEVIARGLPVGLGGLSQWYHRLDGQLAASMMAIHSVKGVEIGLGFESAARRGSNMHDQIYYSRDGDPVKKRFFRKTNNAGGLEGGMTNGEDVVVRVAAKPISTLNQPLHSVDVVSKKAVRAMVERTDNCVIPALAVVCEAAMALVLADAFLRKFGADNLVETERNYRAYLEAEY